MSETTDMNITVVHTLPEKEWRRFVDEHPQGNIFHTPEMFQVFARTQGYRTTLWAAVDSGGRLMALLLPVEITLMGGPLRWLTTRAVAYGSVLCAPDLESKEALRVLLRAYKREVNGRLLFTELRNLSDSGDLQSALNECGFVYEEHLNFLVDLARPQEEIWQSIRPNARRNIKKAWKSQVVIREVNDPNQVPAAHALLKNTYERLQVPLADTSLFRSTFEILYPRGMFKIFMAQVGDVDVGVMTLLLYKDIVYYWYAGMVREYASYRAGDLLVWHALEWGSQNGFRILDLGGAGKPDEEYGVRDFKAKYGGELVNYGRNVCVHAPMRLKLSQLGYQLVRRLL
jgi:lipid II:glycine glycyltransferase (peptidoglycan interpeptide bridge formation enzyme)